MFSESALPLSSAFVHQVLLNLFIQTSGLIWHSDSDERAAKYTSRSLLCADVRQKKLEIETTAL